MKGTLTLLSFNNDVLYEILGLLDARDLIMVRQVCRILMTAAKERGVWRSVYKCSPLLLPAGPLPHHQAKDLERLLIRSTHLYSAWGPNASRDQRISASFTFPRALPAYSFDAQVISGRYLQLAEPGIISWYDLDGDCTKPLLTYECPYIAAITGYMSYQTNAQGEGDNSIWVTFLCSYPVVIMVLKLRLDLEPTVTLEATLSADCTVEAKLGSDYILSVKEFISPDEPLELFHIPTKTIFYAPRHTQVQSLGDLTHMSYLFSSNHLFMLFPSKSETHIEVLRLPHCEDSIPPPNSLLKHSHRGNYPHMMSRTNLFNRRPSNLPRSDPPLASEDDDIITMLSVVYMRRTPSTWTSKVNLHLLDVRLRPSGAIDFSTRASQTLQVGIADTSLFSTSHNGTGFAVTHSRPGPTIRVYHIENSDDDEACMSAQSLKLPAGFQSREMLAFDGYRGRLCLLKGYTNIEIIDYA